MPINRSQIARAIFSAAESMGISDRKKIDKIIDQVIEQTEPRSLPGMEDLVPGTKNKTAYTPSVAEIQNLVKQLLIKEAGSGETEKESAAERTAKGESTQNDYHGQTEN